MCIRDRALSERENSIQRLQDQLAQAEDIVREIEIDKDSIAEDLKQARAEIDRLRTLTDETQKSLNSLRSNEKDLHDNLTITETTIKKYKSSILNILESLSIGSEDLRRFNMNTEIDLVLKQINSSVCSLLDEKREREHRLREAQSEMARLNQKLEEAETEKRSLNLSCQSIKDEKERILRELLAQKEEGSQLRGEFYELKVAYENAIKESEARSHELEERIDVHLHQLEERQERMNIEKANIEFVLERVRWFVGDTEALQVIYEMANVKKRLDETHLELSYLERELNAKPQKPRKVLDEIRDEHSSKSSELMILETQLRSLETELSQIKRLDANREKSLRDLEEEKRQLAAELKVLKRDMFKGDFVGKPASSMMLDGRGLNKSYDLQGVLPSEITTQRNRFQKIEDDSF
eukprot:TRINITY_DN9723_c0_g1_i2.p1 TRINITY_DN9723_c0_g1~~TRINITY_DN9723_c0_g1_i2.p1  ORF type:complete len:410 (-),score=100.31 TRINITY_DN9723_c0_g1_i2:120-1349(-)